MGQQQLLLLVFGIVLVGGAVVMGAHAFGEVKPVENRAIVFQEGLAVVHALQRWKQTPTVAGGGANLVGFERVNFRSLGISHTMLSNRVHKTDFGCYILTTRGEQDYAELTISAPSCSERDFVTRVVVRGPTAADLDWMR